MVTYNFLTAVPFSALFGSSHEVFKQIIQDVEEHMDEVKEDVKNQNVQTANAIKVLTREVIKLQEGNPSQSSSPTIDKTPAVNKHANLKKKTSPKEHSKEPAVSSPNEKVDDKEDVMLC